MSPFVLVTIILLTTKLILIHSNEFSSEYCPPSYQPIGDGCYFFGQFKLNWFRAMEFCHSFGKDSSLVVIETEQENNYLKQWLIKHGDPDTGVWVGGSDNGHHGIWTWFASGDLIRWWDWGPGQPQPGKDQHCLYVVGGWLGYQWADFHCDFQMTFMCEYNVRKRLTVWDSYFKPNKSNKRKNSKYSNMKDQIQPTHNYVLRIQNSKANPPFITTTKSTSTTERVTLKTSNPTIVTTTLLDLISDQKSDESDDKLSDETAWAIVDVIKTIFLSAFNK